MSDSDDEPVQQLKRQGTGLSLSLPASKRDDTYDAPETLAALLLVFEDGEWKTEVDVSYTVEYVKALAREHFTELTKADGLVRGRPPT